ncbi:hemin uptake protein HemP [Methylocystis heyeri]|uniref:Hemin uptake protein HemP n=1 Tax=Methylocystis heyeri TaxID=391905 RepID=A0A6B8KGX2_9HYPH|nr:hemin uptake protein HemP [Methylocystis heyeri]
MERRSKKAPQREAIAGARGAEDAPAPLEMDARELLGPRQEMTIIHAGERYRLRVTANNKLILTK